MSEVNVQSFYALASEAYRLRDAERLCLMHAPAYRDKVVRQAVKGGLQVETCEDLFAILFAAEPDGYLDQLSKVRVKGRTATLMSGDDPWRISMVDGRMMIVDPVTRGR